MRPLVRSLRLVLAWALALLVFLLRQTCRREVRDDPRPALRAAGRTYLYALLHAHQVAAVLVNDDVGIAAMVSRSADGDLLAPALRVTGVEAVRGSSRRQGRDKGGRTALHALAGHMRLGRPALLAVDGPNGPRNHIHRGVVDLARSETVVIVPCVIIPSRRWIFRRTWDRFQIPQPFCRLRMTFAPPLDPLVEQDDLRLRAAVRQALVDLERREDPEEAARAQPSDSATEHLGDVAAGLR